MAYEAGMGEAGGGTLLIYSQAAGNGSFLRIYILGSARHVVRHAVLDVLNCT